MQLNLSKKLKNLGLVETSPIDVLHNLSSRVLTEAESKLLNKGLDFSLYSSRLDVQHIRAEFENLYSKLCNLLSTSQCLISKQKLIRLYSRFVTNYFHKKRRKLSKSILNEGQNCALKSSRKDRDIVITKPDKGNGVVILNRNDYVDKTYNTSVLNLKSLFKITLPIINVTTPNAKRKTYKIVQSLCDQLLS